MLKNNRVYDIAQKLPDYAGVNGSVPAFNYRLNYRVSVASRGTSDKLMYGSTLLTKKKEKPFIDPISDIDLAKDAKELEKAYMQQSLFDINEVEFPEYLTNISQCPFIYDYNFISTAKKIVEHKMSPRSRNKVKDKIFSLYRSNLKSHFFVTLTFVSAVSDTLGVSVLNKFFTALRSDFGGKFNYIWIAERQKNGNIHFHCIFDKRFNVVDINRLWVLQQYNSGIENPKFSKELIEKYYIKNSGAEQIKYLLNPVDVVAIKGIQSLSNYLTKYVTKNEDTFHCRVWHCSRTVSTLFTAINVGRSAFALACDPVVNSRFCTRTRKTYVTQSCIIKGKKRYFDKEKNVFGLRDTTEVAVVQTVVNKRYFLEYMDVMEDINKRLLTSPETVDNRNWQIDVHNLIFFSNS